MPDEYQLKIKPRRSRRMFDQALKDFYWIPPKTRAIPIQISFFDYHYHYHYHYHYFYCWTITVTFTITKRYCNWFAKPSFGWRVTFSVAFPLSEKDTPPPALLCRPLHVLWHLSVPPRKSATAPYGASTYMRYGAFRHLRCFSNLVAPLARLACLPHALVGWWLSPLGINRSSVTSVGSGLLPVRLPVSYLLVSLDLTVKVLFLVRSGEKVLGWKQNIPLQAGIRTCQPFHLPKRGWIIIFKPLYQFFSFFRDSVSPLFSFSVDHMSIQQTCPPISQ